MELRRFNDHGIQAFEAYLRELAASPQLQPPVTLLESERHTESLDDELHATPRAFENRMAFATWLQRAADAAGARVPQRDAGFWSWLSLLLFDQVCPPKDGRRRAGELARYVPSTDWRRRYRHLLATPYGIFYMHKEDPTRAAVVLNQPMHVLGELTEQFASRQELISCPGTMGLATLLFVESSTGQPRTGASGIAARRLGTLLNQYTRTWDISVMSPSQAARLLPREFDRFKKVGGAE